MSRLKTSGFCIAIFLLLLSGCASMPKKPETSLRGDYGYTKEYVSWMIREEMDAHRVTGLSIALVDDQKVVWAEGFGYADKDNGIAAAPDTVYRTGPVSQLFTATAIMQLADDHALNLDKPLTAYLPEFSVKSRFPYAAPITPRNLLSHHAGLPADRLQGMWTRRPEPFGEQIGFLKDEYLASPPDSIYSPSTVGFSLLGHAVETITGRDFAPQLSLALFLPLRMESSAFSGRIDRSPQGSRAYRDGVEAEEPPLRDLPALGLNSTVLDLSRYISMVFADGEAGGRMILKPGTLAEMLRPQNAGATLDLSLRTGLGWELDGPGDEIRNGGPVARIGGGTLYHRSRVVLLPEQKLGVVVLANSASAGSVVDRVAAETLKLALEAKAGITQAPRPKSEEDEMGIEGGNIEAATVAQMSDADRLIAQLAAALKEKRMHDKPEKRKVLTPEDLPAFEGRYATPAGIVPIVRKKDHLEAALPGQPPILLAPRPDGLLSVNPGLPVPFAASDVGIDRATVDGRAILKVVADGREFLAGERLAAAPVPEGWLHRLGRYEIVNGEDDTLPVKQVLLRHDAGLLVAEYALPITGRTMTWAMAPLSDTEALICSLGQGRGETVRVVTRKGEDLLAYSGYLFRKTGQ
jgi:CubicO group peptidase (beta-lactamase class C family)